MLATGSTVTNLPQIQKTNQKCGRRTGVDGRSFSFLFFSRDVCLVLKLPLTLTGKEKKKKKVFFVWWCCTLQTCGRRGFLHSTFLPAWWNFPELLHGTSYGDFMCFPSMWNLIPETCTEDFIAFYYSIMVGLTLAALLGDLSLQLATIMMLRLTNMVLLTTHSYATFFLHLCSQKPTSIYSDS